VGLIQQGGRVSVLNCKEVLQVLLNMLLTPFARLPHFLICEFACGAFWLALGMLGWMIMDCTVVLKCSYMFNHLCCDSFDPRSYEKMDGADSGAPEQRNAPIRRIQRVCRAWASSSAPACSRTIWLLSTTRRRRGESWGWTVCRKTRTQRVSILRSLIVFAATVRVGWLLMSPLRESAQTGTGREKKTSPTHPRV